MSVDERKNRLRAALAEKSTEELDDLLASSFAEDTEPDVEYIEAILGVIREREGPEETEEELDRAWANFKEHLQAREDFEKEEATSIETGITEELSHEHMCKTEYRQNSRKFFRIFRNGLIAAVIIVLLCSSAFGWNIFKTVAQWGAETFRFLTVHEVVDTSYRDVFEELRCAITVKTDTPAVPTWAPEGTEAVGEVKITGRQNQHVVTMLYSIGERQFSVKVTIHSTMPEKHPTIYQKDAEIEETYKINGIDHYILGNNGNLTSTWYNSFVEGHVQGELTVEEMHKMLDSIYEE